MTAVEAMYPMKNLWTRTEPKHSADMDIIQSTLQKLDVRKSLSDIEAEALLHYCDNLRSSSVCRGSIRNIPLRSLSRGAVLVEAFEGLQDTLRNAVMFSTLSLGGKFVSTL